MRISMSRVAKAGGVAVASLALAVPAATTATAQNDAASSMGNTRVAINPPVYRLLADSGIMVRPRGMATAAPFRNTVAAKFPIYDIRNGGKLILHKGGLKFYTHDVDINTGRFRISLVKNHVTGAVSGSEVGHVGRVVLFKLAKSHRPRLGDVKLTLTRVAAGAFNATFGVKAFSKGDNFGFASVNPR